MYVLAVFTYRVMQGADHLLITCVIPSYSSFEIPFYSSTKGAAFSVPVLCLNTPNNDSLVQMVASYFCFLEMYHLIAQSKRHFQRRLIGDEKRIHFNDQTQL